MRGDSLCRGSEARAGLGVPSPKCSHHGWCRAGTGQGDKMGHGEAGLQAESQVQGHGEPLRAQQGSVGGLALHVQSPGC